MKVLLGAIERAIANANVQAVLLASPPFGPQVVTVRAPRDVNVGDYFVAEVADEYLVARECTDEERHILWARP